MGTLEQPWPRARYGCLVCDAEGTRAPEVWTICAICPQGARELQKRRRQGKYKVVPPTRPTKRKVAHGHMTSHRGTSQIGATVGVRSRVGQADQGQGLRRIWRWIGTKRRAAVCDGLEVVPPLSPAILMTHEPILTSRARAARTLTPYSDCASRSFGRRPARPNSWRAYCKKRRAHAGINPTLAARAGTTRR